MTTTETTRWLAIPGAPSIPGVRARRFRGSGDWPVLSELTMAANTLNVIAIEFLAACQGIDFRKPLKTSPALRQAHEALRAQVPFASADRLLAEDIAAAADVIRHAPVQSLASDLLPSFR